MNNLVHKFSVKQIPGDLLRQFGHKVELWDLMNMLDSVVKRIGGLNYVDYMAKIKVDKEDLSVLVPCNAHKIVYVASPYKMMDEWMSISSVNSLQNALINYRVTSPPGTGEEMGDEITNTNDVVYEINPKMIERPKGAFIDFTVHPSGEKIYISQDIDEVIMAFQGIQTEPEGFPVLNERTYDALLKYANFMAVSRLFYQRKAEHFIYKEAELLKDKAMARARAPKTMTENDIHKMVNVLHNLNKYYERYDYRTKY